MAQAAGTVLHNDAVDWLRLIRAEYLEMPGLHLTLAQARQLWRLDASTSSAVLDVLVEAGFLRRTDRGAYVRAGAQ
ncbi:MAG: hypothetical protein AB7L91_02370 [Dehalococcoidia bacterium]